MRALYQVTPEMLKTPFGRLRAYLAYNVIDHGFLRVWWTNTEEIAPGVWRSNQPGPRRVAHYAKMGIKTLVILRGVGTGSYYQLELDAARKAGLSVITLDLSARSAPHPRGLKPLFEAFREAERPFLMHCKSGADRAGLASALYLLWIGCPLDEARKMLSWRYVHLSSTATGILDVMLDQYEDALRKSPISIEDWVFEHYDRETLTAQFAEGRRHGEAWPKA